MSIQSETSGGIVYTSMSGQGKDIPDNQKNICLKKHRIILKQKQNYI